MTLVFGWIFWNILSTIYTLASKQLKIKKKAATIKALVNYRI